ncbi:tRNA (N6-isopentenyl adenosine(37)-C2)-methylthiotransferase MiaB [bacterium]|nr:tRNA (N6-isopentenyl adenosine(37)-C2)-methylthiotransferase MiaB [candidate division CSSED10-310 bacterium]
MSAAAKFYIETFGCQMNVHDSEKLEGHLVGHGWCKSADPELSDVIILNTCSVREKAEHKVLSRVGRLHRIRRRNPGLCIVLAGCMAQAWGTRLFDSAVPVDMVLGPGAMVRLPDYYTRFLRNRDPVADTSEPEAIFPLDTRLLPLPRHHFTYLTIMEGCDNYCSYCIVPHVRGRERSKPADQIMMEIGQLVKRGVREITLLGQNVNSYRGCPGGFPELLARIDSIPDLLRIRFTTSHPKDISPALVDAVSCLPRVCEYIHFPAQSGSTPVLTRMNRGYSREDYLEKVALIRDRIPGVALSSDMIVGFPGETDADYDRTISLIRQVRFDNVFAFKYCTRPGTSAAELVDDVPGGVKSDRLSGLIDIQRGISLQINREWIGRTAEVLIDGPDRRGGKLTGRTRQNRIVNLQGECGRGELIPVRIEGASPNCLYGVQV